MLRVDLPEGGRGESNEGPADAAATSVILLIEATSLTIPSTATAASSRKEQFVDMEISKVDLKRSEFEKMPESRKVRRISGLAVCSMDIVGTAQSDYDNPQLFGVEFEQKANEESDATYTHEGEPDKVL